MHSFPIDSLIPKLKEALMASSGAVLAADPGAGKTTRVPLALMDEVWLQGKKIVMLEPRRLAARAAARYMAASLEEPCGDTVGYRVRNDTCAGPNTRIEVVTEGVLTRMLQRDQALEDTGLIIFDEFHERSLHADLGLALSLQSQQLLRPELRILVMSATLHTGPVSALLGNVPILHSEGRVYPVQTIYSEQRQAARVEERAAAAVRRALAQQPEGDILVFLPGTGEIARTAGYLRSASLPASTVIRPLHGNLPLEEQDHAITPDQQGRRKIVLSTSIAESSLTVQGVRIVIDGGLMRVSRFSPRTGLSRLETVTVSRASADQRRGRAGRLAPGVCYRLWTEEEDRQLAPFSRPEMMDADLSALALELAAWGVRDPQELDWLDVPPGPAFRQGSDVLEQLGALDEAGRLTAHGELLAESGLHPRLGSMIIHGRQRGYGAEACLLAGILSERDVLRKEEGRTEADIRLRMEALCGGGLSGYRLDPGRSAGILAEYRRYQSQFGMGATKLADIRTDAAGLLLAFAYPDRIAKQRSHGKFLLRSGRGAALAELQPLSVEPYLVVAELDDQGTESRIQLAAAIALEQIIESAGAEMRKESTVEWSRDDQAVRARTRTRLGELVLEEKPLARPDAQLVASALADGIRQHGLVLLPWTKPLRQLQQRLEFMHGQDARWPGADDAALLESLSEWLVPHLYGMRNLQELKRVNLKHALESILTWEQQRQLDQEAPTHITVPSGSRIAVDYSEPAAPVLAVRLQELFGLLDTPRIGTQKIPLTLHLLSPAGRPVQVTRDLKHFWSSTYFDVKKDLKGRYPKHYWPDDPFAALPTSRVRPRT
ncbi:ATP-dependent helicase HrpB [Paenibacillus sp. GCM10012307]|uniref:ATP-dependent helicase HrpB n=1 Tax=Paenibacillus roseus TaxID=2798579 RepID=A0A934MXD0_9BACL|nr:ATP-dependent helicase HrpB [Paenibacillus roseus]MBJ6364062.1 ATP-dependent helicase HrpB [Paenibacillus roseus]